MSPAAEALIAARHRGSSVSSAATWNTGAADSIFRLLPRETRPCISRMLTVTPGLRSTFAELLRGGEGDNVDESIKDDWLCGIRVCVDEKCKPKIGDPDYHDHVKISAEEPKKKRK